MMDLQFYQLFKAADLQIIFNFYFKFMVLLTHFNFNVLTNWVLHESGFYVISVIQTVKKEVIEIPAAYEMVNNTHNPSIEI